MWGMLTSVGIILIRNCFRSIPFEQRIGQLNPTRDEMYSPSQIDLAD
jgi:hypothetical protein